MPKGPRRKSDKSPTPEEKPSPPPRVPRLSRRMAELPVVQVQKKEKPEQFQLKRGDNSNTQFAILGLWSARKHGIAAEASLEFAAKHFRRTQNGNGGWGYATGTPTKKPRTPCWPSRSTAAGRMRLNTSSSGMLNERSTTKMTVRSLVGRDR